MSYYCAQYIHQATQGESKRVTDKYITLSSTSQDTVHNKAGHLAETKGGAAVRDEDVGVSVRQREVEVGAESPMGELVSVVPAPTLLPRTR